MVHTRSPSAGRLFRPQPPQPVRVRYDLAYPPSFQVWEVRHAGLVNMLVFAFIGTVFFLVGAVWIATWML